MSTRPVMRATWYVAAPSMLFGLIDVLVPLRLTSSAPAPAWWRPGSRSGPRWRPHRPRRRTDLRPDRAAAALRGWDADLRRRDPVPLVAALPLCRGPGPVLGRRRPLLYACDDDAQRLGRGDGLASRPGRRADKYGLGGGQVAGGAGEGALARAAGDALPCLLAAAWLVATALAAWQGGTAEREGRTVGAEAG